MKVLFVAYEFPPLGSGGVQRSMKFAKYLPEYGITPIVVTTDRQSFARTMNCPMDESLLNELPEDLLVERISCPPVKSGGGKLSEWRRIFFSLVEPQAKLWRTSLDQRLHALFEKYRPQAIYVSMPPFGMGPLWCQYAKKYGLPIILDFRDAWSQWRISPYGSWLHYRLTLRLERQCLEDADRVVCSSNQIRQDLLKIHKGIPENKLVTITNGYDSEISDWNLEPTELTKAGQFVIGYVGSFYYSPIAREGMMLPWWRKKPHRMLQYSPRKEDWLYRSPYFFFRTVALLLKQRPELRDRIKIRFAGQKATWIDAQVNTFGLGDIVEFVGYLSHEQVLEFQRQCDCLLVTSSKVIGGRDYSIAGKTFEYFSLKKPILAFVTEGAQKDILKESMMSILCDPDQSEESASQLLNLIEGRSHLSPEPALLQKLHRRLLTESLAKIFKQLQRQSNAAFISCQDVCAGQVENLK